MIKDDDFVPFRKIPRLSREIVITEKIDGTNAQIKITEDGEMIVGSRNKVITPKDDNYGFANWCEENKEELMKLGVGTHYGEWWGQGIGRGYGLKTKKFSLFNVSRWGNPEERPNCCDVVPILYRGTFTTEAVTSCMIRLRTTGSYATSYEDPEGIVIYHTQGNLYFKKTLKNDEKPKGEL